MLQAEMPFGSWRESELDTFAKIAKGQFTLPETFSPEVVDLITKLLQVDPNLRLGSQGSDSVKNHRWFDGISWEAIRAGSFSIPQEITYRVNLYLENHGEDCTMPIVSPSFDLDELNTREWLEDW